MTTLDYAGYIDIHPYVGTRPAFARLSKGRGYITLNNAATAMLGGAQQIRVAYSPQKKRVRIVSGGAGQGHAITLRNGQASFAAGALLQEAPLEPGIRYPIVREGNALYIEVGQ